MNKFISTVAVLVIAIFNPVFIAGSIAIAAIAEYFYVLLALPSVFALTSLKFDKKVLMLSNAANLVLLGYGVYFVSMTLPTAFQSKLPSVFLVVYFLLVIIPLCNLYALNKPRGNAALSRVTD